MSGAFEKLARPIQKWIRQQGWRELRDIQARTIHAVYADCAKDLIVAASTAGGKTEAAFLPLISQVLDTPSQQVGFDLLYVGPLKALITRFESETEEDTFTRPAPEHVIKLSAQVRGNGGRGGGVSTGHGRDQGAPRGEGASAFAPGSLSC